ncbi:COQ9-domain-containing protein [Chlamydoabsidia padenii]|nr:COQ9-domain-containing protein [Chlamydoabsidia padenii]
MLRSLTPLCHVKSTVSFYRMTRPFSALSSSVQSYNTTTNSTTKAHEQPSNNDQHDIRQSLLQATLRHVPAHGWTMESLARGASDMNLPSVVHGVFPGGPIGLIDAYLDQCQQQFTQFAIQQSPKETSIPQRVRTLTARRLDLLEPYARRWPEALAILAHPTHASIGFRHLSNLVDDIWYYAGDRSPDMNWYTKRAALAAIYSATELYMSQDISPGFVETYRFLDRRLDEAEWVDGATSQLGTMLTFGAKSLIGSITQSRGH